MTMTKKSPGERMGGLMPKTQEIRMNSDDFVEVVRRAIGVSMKVKIIN